MIFLKAILFALCLALITACGSSASLSSTQAAPATSTTARAKLTPTLTISIATASPTQPYQMWTARQVIDAFEAAGLETGEYHINDPLDLFGAPPLAVEFIRFFVPSRGQDAGGMVSSFASQEDFDMVYQHHKDLGWHDSGLYYPWVYVRDNILLQINGILSEPEAQKYADALDHMR